MNTKIVFQGIQNLLVRRYMGPFWYRRQWLNKTQWLSKEGLTDIQFNLLKRTIRYAERHVPYYQTLMRDRGFSSEDIRSLEDIKLFPILTKRDIISAGDTILSQTLPKFLLRHAFTGGTTGTPVNLYRSLFSIGNEHAFVRRQWDWAGVGFNDRCAYLTGRLIAKSDQEGGKLHAYDPIMKELILSTYHLSKETAKDYGRIMNQYKVKVVVGYPSAVYLLARTCLDFKIKLKLQSALISSETLTESMRDTISKAFDCQVFDFYGSAERVCYIHTCERGSYHIIPEYGLTELIPVDDSKDGRCEVVSTGFWNMSMPLIRYNMNDIVIKSGKPCSCGRQFSVIKSIDGRKGDVIKTPSGREFGAAILTHLLYGTNHIVESQIIQDSLDHIIVEYVPGKQFTNKDMVNFKKLIVQHLPGELKVDLEQVTAIRRTSSGKIQPVVSQLGL